MSDYSSSGLIQTTLGDSVLLAQPASHKLWILNRAAAALWTLFSEGVAVDAAASALVQRFGLKPDDALVQVSHSYQEWVIAQESQSIGAETVYEPLPILSLARHGKTQSRPSGFIQLAIADVVVRIRCTDDDLRRSLLQTFQLARDVPSGFQSRQQITVCDLEINQSGHGWVLALGIRKVVYANDLQSLISTLVWILCEIGSRPAERLLVAHAAGIRRPDGDVLLLVGAGGSGKTTLAAALDAEGYEFLGDDVVPVDNDGMLWPLGLPLCVKQGSWDLLCDLRPDLNAVYSVERQGWAVKFLPAKTPAAGPLKLGGIVLNRHAPGKVGQLRRIKPEIALRGIVEAESVIGKLDQGRLDRIAIWVESACAYQLDYPDLDTGRRLIKEVMSKGERGPPFLAR